MGKHKYSKVVDFLRLRRKPIQILGIGLVTSQITEKVWENSEFPSYGFLSIFRIKCMEFQVR